MKAVAATLTSLALVSLLAGSANAADDFPNKQITITNIYAVGGGQDLIARAVGNKLSQKWGVPVVMESKPALAARLQGPMSRGSLPTVTACSSRT
ncbi:MAG: hypothetical protein WDN48_12855 [Pseudolabrys sp.]